MSDENLIEYCYTWKIENYSLCFRNAKEELKSPTFTPDNFQGSKWYLVLNPLHEKIDNDFISCYLYRHKKDLCGKEITISLIIQVLDGNGKIIATRGNNHSNAKFCRGTSIGWNSFAKVEDIISQCLTWNEDILTVRCRMFTIMKCHESVALTEIGIDKCSFEWEVKFPGCVTVSQTRKFSLSTTSKYEISLTAPSDLIEIKVMRVEEDHSSFRLLRGNIFLLNQEKVKVLSQSTNHLFDLTDANNTWNFTSFISKKLLEDNEKNYLKNGCFTLLCEFSTTNGKESSEILNGTSCFASKCNNILNLYEDLSILFTSMKHSDVELQCGNTIVPAHKSLLIARSPVFSAMFDHDMIKKQSGVADIPETDPETLKSFLEFIYTGRVDMNDNEGALKLLTIADRYQVLSLKETCSMFLMSSISLKNACEILDLADLFNLKQLKKCALDFFAKYMKDILKSPQWSKSTETDKERKLSTEIISHLANNYEISPKIN